MILNIFKLEAPREKGKCGSKMAGKDIFDLCFSGREMVVVLNLNNQDASLAFCLWLDCCLVLSRYLLTQENRKTDKGFSTSTLPRHTHTLYPYSCFLSLSIFA